METTCRTTAPTSRILSRAAPRRLLGAASLALVAGVISGCTGTAEPSSTASPTAGPGTATAVPTTTSSATPKPGDRSAVDPSRPFDIDEMKDWAQSIVDTIPVEPGTSLQGGSSHLDEESTQRTFVDYQSLAPGEYTFWYACRGGGELTFSITSGGVTSPTLAGACTGQVQSGDFTAAEGGTKFEFSNVGDPVDWVTRFTPRISAPQ
ncbi:MAG: hypothetical protein Q7T71_19685 [Herbiconiux sp.]|nr:hypothetical protein [Herbiconiux sp.]